MSDVETRKGVPGPFPALLQTSSVTQNTNLQDTAPQADVAAKTNQPAQAISSMQNVQPFLPGLYVVGAFPSGGMTTFSWQLANQ